MATERVNENGRRVIHGAVIGYGAAFNMGKAHIGWMNATPGLAGTAVCDLDPVRLEAARQDYPGIKTYGRVEELLADSEIDLVTIVVPHNVHAPLAIQCLNAGKHVVVEKPMCITVDEATSMIEAARAKGVMLSVFHNRRFDGDYMAIKEVIEKGLIGPVFQVELCGGGYRHPGTWWRSNKVISGGAFYDWGAHFVDWVLGIIPEKVTSVTGFFHKRVWLDVTNEDHVQAIVRFGSGAVADIQISSIARAPRPRWRILGEKGGIIDEGKGSFKVFTEVAGISAEMEVKYKPSAWENYYRNISEHLHRGVPLAVTPESARRVIAIIETAEKSAKSGVTEPVPFD